jgi:pyruvate dehydrogenase E2 component (dihydrolipoamide acetyltransferase)
VLFRSGIDLGNVSGTGPGGMITKADVLRFSENAAQSATPLPVASKDNRALAAMAATVIASKRDIPHFYATTDVSMSQAAAWRRRWNEDHADLHATYNDLFVLCAARSLKDNPRLNVSYSAGSYKQQISADVLLVVAHEPAMLLVPVADPSALSAEVFFQAMRKAAKTSVAVAAQPLLAISNLGMFGVKQFAAIIPPGSTSVLAIGAVREQALIKNGKVESELVCSLTLSADHRVVDGVAAAKFLERIQFHLNSL